MSHQERWLLKPTTCTKDRLIKMVPSSSRNISTATTYNHCSSEKSSRLQWNCSGTGKRKSPRTSRSKVWEC